MKTEEEKKHIEKKIFDTARQSLQTSGADRLLCERMLGREPRTGTESLKIRYWRTGRYTPVNREQCLRLAGALELTEEFYRCFPLCDRAGGAQHQDSAKTHYKYPL